MMILFLFLSFAGHSFASNSTNLVGWQFERNSRSTWDILWACFSTIVACTWTVIHADVPPRNISDARFTIKYLRTWFQAILVPELVLALAVGQFVDARELKAACNAAQKRRSTESAESKLPLSTPNRSSKEIRGSSGVNQAGNYSKWTLSQSFCGISGGLALQTQDDWIYTLRPDEDMVLFIESGIISAADFRERDIRDRAKADSFAKAFTLFQTTWFLSHVIARWAYELPVSPIELITVAYVVLAIAIYGLWWHKPKDMSTAVTVPLHCERANLPSEVSSTMEENCAGWVHLRTPIEEVSAASVYWKSIVSPFLSNQGQDYEAVKELKGHTPPVALFLSGFYGFVALVYCGIHVAAWNFTFPTHAEWVAWFALSFTSIGMVFIFTFVNCMKEVVRILEAEDKLPPLMRIFIQPTLGPSPVIYIKRVTLYIYMVARLGITGLVFSALRALPKDAYTSIDWVTSIPHV